MVNQQDQAKGKTGAFAMWVPIASGVGAAMGAGMAAATGQMGTQMGFCICLGVPVGIVAAATVALLWRGRRS